MATYASCHVVVTYAQLLAAASDAAAWRFLAAVSAAPPLMAAARSVYFSVAQMLPKCRRFFFDAVAKPVAAIVAKMQRPPAQPAFACRRGCFLDAGRMFHAASPRAA
jgi:hypothetical protein